MRLLFKAIRSFGNFFRSLVPGSQLFLQRLLLLFQFFNGGLSGRGSFLSGSALGFNIANLLFEFADTLIV